MYVCVSPYVVNLLPCLLRICQRPEEMVHETLAGAMAKISPVLVGFMTDIETKVTRIETLREHKPRPRQALTDSVPLTCIFLDCSRTHNE